MLTEWISTDAAFSVWKKFFLLQVRNLILSIAPNLPFKRDNECLYHQSRVTIFSLVRLWKWKWTSAMWENVHSTSYNWCFINFLSAVMLESIERLNRSLQLFTMKVVVWLRPGTVLYQMESDYKIQYKCLARVTFCN